MKKKFFTAMLLALLLPGVGLAKERFQAKWISQDQGTWGTMKAHVLLPGKSLTVTAKFQNVGTDCWSSDDKQDFTSANDTFVGFYVYKDQTWSTPASYNDQKNSHFGSSLWAGSGWGTSRDGKTQNARAAKLKESSVCPGSTGTFSFTLNAPSDNQYTNNLLDTTKTKIDERIHREDLSLAASRAWMKADAAYPKGTGDPAGIAHVWFPVRFEDGVLTQQEVNDYVYYLTPASQDVHTSILEFEKRLDSLGNSSSAANDLKNYVKNTLLPRLATARSVLQNQEAPYEMRTLRQPILDIVDYEEKAFSITIPMLEKEANGTLTQAEGDKYLEDFIMALGKITVPIDEVGKEIQPIKSQWPGVDVSSLGNILLGFVAS
ncbi:MAG: hypothetical protein WCP97_05675 [bacterium]